MFLYGDDKIDHYQGNFPLPEICTLAYLVNLPVYTHAIGSANLNTVAIKKAREVWDDMQRELLYVPLYSVV